MTNIKLTDIQEKMLAFHVIKELELEEGKKIGYYSKFETEKLNLMFQDVIENIKYSNTLDKKYPANDLDMILFLNFFAIKHFTTLKDELEGKDYETHIATMNALINIGWFNKIINAFDATELNKANTAFYNTIEYIEEIGKLTLENTPQG